jgi:hypothetical protein
MPALSRLRALPWMVLLDLVIVARGRWGRLEAGERRRLGVLVGALARDRRVPTAKERELLRSVAAKLDLTGVPRELVPRLVGMRGRRG